MSELQYKNPVPFYCFSHRIVRFISDGNNHLNEIELTVTAKLARKSSYGDTHRSLPTDAHVGIVWLYLSDRRFLGISLYHMILNRCTT